MIILEQSMSHKTKMIMKTIISCCTAFVASFIIISFQGFSQAPTSGLQIHLPFTGNANDASGNGRNGILSGGVTSATDRFGNANQAYAFNGSNGSIDVNNWNILTGNSPRTMMVWFKTTLPNTVSQFFLAWGALANSATSVMGAYSSGLYYFGFWGYNNDLWVTNQFQFYDNQWHLMAVTFDGSNLSLYLDGALATSKTTTLATGTSRLTIGNRIGGDFFNGSLDDIRVYNRALTVAEIRDTYKAEASTTTTAEVIRLGTDRVFSVAGTANTMVGLRAGAFSTGNYNTFLGSGGVGLSNSGNENIFMGYKTGFANASGSNNTFIGNSVASKSTTASNNVYIGWASGNENTTGGDNTALGTQAGGLTTSGSYNTSFGKLSGYFNITGSLNTYLGAGADGFGANKGNLSNATAIGANAKVSINDAIVLGDTANVNIKVGIGTTRPAKRLEVRTANPNESGIRTTNLTASSPTIAGNGKVLTVNTLGDFILVPDGGSGTNTHSDSVWVRTATNTNYTGGNVGIGVPVPQFKLDVAGPINIRGINGNSLMKFGSVNFIRSDKNLNGAFGFDAEVDSNYYHSMAIGYKAYASANNVLVLGGIGENAVNVGIGNSAPQSSLEITSKNEGESGLMFTNLTQNFTAKHSNSKFLSVDEKGKVGLYNLSADQITLKISNPNQWSDNVFASNYQLMPINKVENFIKTEGHLPNIPSAKEMTEKGVSAQEMFAKLLAKNEELMLYILEQNKINIKQAKEIEELKKEVQELKNK